MNLQYLLREKLLQALTGFVPEPAPFADMVRPTQDAKFGDYQANCAMQLAKTLGKKPRDVAQELVARLDLGDCLQPPEIAGPGFINLRFQPEWLAKQVEQLTKDDRLGVTLSSKPRTYVIDFSSPNVAKPMHVGHLRSTIIGDALSRVLRFLGHRVITDNHLGDWGTQFGMLLYGYKHLRDDAALAADPVREMVRIYVSVRNRIKPAEKDEDEEEGPAKHTPEEIAAAQVVLDAVRQETAKLHAGDPENVRLWNQFMPWCLEDLARIYRRLDVHHDESHGESFYNPMLPAVVDELLAQGIAQASEGAVAIFLRENEPPALVRKRDGAFTYTTSDLATIRHRIQQWKPDAILYVVDFRQSLHFTNLFAAARRWGYDQVTLEHVSFGSVLGPDRKPIKTREGGAIELGALLDEAAARAARVYEQLTAEALARGEDVPTLDQAQKDQIAEVVGLGAVKYADLSQSRTSDYVFSWEKMLAMEGNTATYMQYAYARNRGIFRKGGVDPTALRASAPAVTLVDAAERGLALELLRFGEALEAAAAEYKPSMLTSYLWDLAKSYNAFFDKCPVLKAPTLALRDSRLLLCDLTARTIQKGLSLLGIGTLERM